MAISANKARKHLSADSLFAALRGGFKQLPDLRRGESLIPLPDALMAGFAMFSLKDPSLLAFDNRRHDPNENFRTLYSIDHCPCDTQMRALLDPVDPDSLKPLFADVFRRLQRGKALQGYTYVDDCYLISLDGTTYFSSRKIHCPSAIPGWSG